MTARIVLYGRPGCSLCEESKAMLNRLGLGAAVEFRLAERLTEITTDGIRDDRSAFDDLCIARMCSGEFGNLVFMLDNAPLPVIIFRMARKAIIGKSIAGLGLSAWQDRLISREVALASAYPDGISVRQERRLQKMQTAIAKEAGG